MAASNSPPLPPPKDAVYRTSPHGLDTPESDAGSSAESADLRIIDNAGPSSFDIEDNPEADIEDGFAKRKTNKLENNRNWWKIWDIMTIRSRRLRPSYEAEEDESLLTGNSGSFAVSNGNGNASPSKRTLRASSLGEVSRRWSIFSMVKYGIIIMLILFSLWMFDSLFIHRKPTDPLANWGKAGTTSEGLSWYPTDFLRDVIPIPCHSHNDYWRRVPLFSALYTGCISVESDVWDFDGDSLLVGHNEASLTPNRTFHSLYINPLVEILERQNPKTEFYSGNSHGVFDTDHEQSLTLLVDVKTDGAKTWPKVLDALQPLRDRGWLTYVEDGVLHKRPIIVVGTGETPFDVLTSNATYRDAFFDAPMATMWKDVPFPSSSDPEPADSSPFLHAKLRSSQQGSSGTSEDDDYNTLNSYYASTSFFELIGIVWFGRLSDKQRHLIRGYIAGVHEQGLKARFWETPTWPRSLKESIWSVLIEEGADILNVDDLDAVKNGLW